MVKHVVNECIQFEGEDAGMLLEVLTKYAELVSQNASRLCLPVSKEAQWCTQIVEHMGKNRSKLCPTKTE